MSTELHEDARTCSATTKNGLPCTARARPGSNWCNWHDTAPDAVTQRREWQMAGGKAKSNANRLRKRVPESLGGVETVLHRALAGLEDGTLEPSRAGAMASVARALIALHEPSELERRLTDLERVAEERRGA